MSKKHLVFFCLISVFLLSSNFSFSEEKVYYHIAKIVRVEQKKEKKISPNPAEVNGSPSKDSLPVEWNTHRDKTWDAMVSKMGKNDAYALVTLKIKNQEVILKYQPDWRFSPAWPEGAQIKVRFDSTGENAYIKQIDGPDLKAKVVRLNKFSQLICNEDLMKEILTI